MNRTELVNAIALQAGTSKKDADAMLKAYVNVVEEAVKAGEKVQLIGFGSFELKERPARKGKNPKTGEAIDIPASKAPVFKAGGAFKQLVK